MAISRPASSRPSYQASTAKPSLPLSAVRSPSLALCATLHSLPVGAKVGQRSTNRSNHLPPVPSYTLPQTAAAVQARPRVPQVHVGQQAQPVGPAAGGRRQRAPGGHGLLQVGCAPFIWSKLYCKAVRLSSVYRPKLLAANGTRTAFRGQQCAHGWSWAPHQLVRVQPSAAQGHGARTWAHELRQHQEGLHACSPLLAGATCPTS